MAKRKKRTVLTNSEKLGVLRELKSGIPRKVIENKYNISERHLCCIVKRADEITVKANLLEFKKKNFVKSTENPKLETALLKWFIQKRDWGQPITPGMVRKKAQVYNEILKESSNFKVIC